MLEELPDVLARRLLRLKRMIIWLKRRKLKIRQERQDSSKELLATLVEISKVESTLEPTVQSTLEPMVESTLEPGPSDPPVSPCPAQ